MAALSARGMSIATAKTSVNAGRHRRTIDKSLGTKEALAMRLKLAIDGEKTLPGGRRTCVPAELPGVVLSAFDHRLFEHRLDRTARTWFSLIGAPESDRLP
jgi:hypothetical protein